MSTKPFHCAYCGKKAHKRTTTVWVQEPGAKQLPGNQFSRHIVPHDFLRSKADCQGYTNGQVVSVTYSTAAPYDFGNGRPERRVHRFSEWDGESWELGVGLFCNAECTSNFAHAALRAGYRMQKADA